MAFFKWMGKMLQGVRPTLGALFSYAAKIFRAELGRVKLGQSFNQLFTIFAAGGDDEPPKIVLVMLGMLLIGSVCHTVYSLGLALQDWYYQSKDAPKGHPEDAPKGHPEDAPKGHPEDAYDDYTDWPSDAYPDWVVDKESIPEFKRMLDRLSNTPMGTEAFDHRLAEVLQFMKDHPDPGLRAPDDDSESGDDCSGD